MSSTGDRVDVARRFYDALTNHDLHALLVVLDPSLGSRITRGIPNGWGGHFSSLDELMTRCWRPIFGELQLRPVPREYVLCDGNRVTVLGEYQGRSRTTGRALDAAFAHVLTVADERIVKLVQVTGSAAWHAAVSQARAIDDGHASPPSGEQ